MKFLPLFLLFSQPFLGQIKGVIVDQNNKPIPYVNVWVENENIGASSEENGEFLINVLDKNKNLIFSAVGYEKKRIKATEASVVILNATTYQLNEITVLNKKETKKIEIGETNNQIYQAFENGPKIDAKYFPYNNSYKKTKFIKQVSVLLDSKIDKATIKIHFYNVAANGLPGEELVDKNHMVEVKKGQKRNIFDVSEFNLTLPQEGIYVAVERLIIEKNKTEKTTTDLITNSITTQRTYSPLILYAYVEREFLCTFYGGKWNKQGNDSSKSVKVFEPAINLVLTN